MSLRDAVTDIAEQMEQEFRDDQSCGALYVYFRLLRNALKASEGESSGPGPALPINDPSHHRRMIEEAKAQMRAAKGAPASEKVAVEEDATGMFAEVVDGPAASPDGTTTVTPINPGMPPGARTYVGSHVYELRADGKLYYVPKKLEVGK